MQARHSFFQLTRTKPSSITTYGSWGQSNTSIWDSQLIILLKAKDSRIEAHKIL